MKGYHHKHGRVSPPFVTALKDGKLVINKTAVAMLQQRSVTHVCLLWDAAEQTFALQPASATTHDAFRLVFRRAQVSLNVPHFWKWIGLSPRDGGQRFIASWDEHTGLLTARMRSAE